MRVSWVDDQIIEYDLFVEISLSPKAIAKDDVLALTCIHFNS